MENQLSEMQQLLLSTFKAFTVYCENNGLTYYAAYGTLLGAIRHHGFIPWDDDIDVYMMREDYDKFITLRKQLANSPYRICDVFDGQSPYPFAKFYLTKGSIWEYRHFPFIIGPWVDVFPIDEGTSGDIISEAAFKGLHYSLWKYRKSIANDTYREILTDFKHLDFIGGGVKLFKKCRYVPFKKFYLKKVARSTDVVRLVKSQNYQVYYGGVSTEYYEKEWFTGAKEVPFEDTTIVIPSGAHEILTSYFGNYMELPPVENRVPKHHCFYMNLKETKNRDEILCECYDKTSKTKRLSLKILIDEIRHRKGF